MVESDDNYIKNGTIDFDATIFKSTSSYNFNAGGSSFNSNSGGNIFLRSSSSIPLSYFILKSGGNRRVDYDYDSGVSYDYDLFSIRSAVGSQVGHTGSYFTNSKQLRTTTTTTTTTTPYIQCKLILYSLTHLRGQSVEIDGDVNSLESLNFDDKVASVDVKGNCCWEIFVDDNFTGDSMFFRRQEYESAVDIQKIYQKASSVQNRSC